MNEMDENKLIGIVYFTNAPASLYEMLAEKASELSTAASEYARYLRDDQPLGEEWTPGAGFAKVIEEFDDVSLCFDMVVRDQTGKFESPERMAVYDAVTEDTKRKLKRWAERMSAE